MHYYSLANLITDLIGTSLLKFSLGTIRMMGKSQCISTLAKAVLFTPGEALSGQLWTLSQYLEPVVHINALYTRHFGGAWEI